MNRQGANEVSHNGNIVTVIRPTENPSRDLLRPENELLQQVSESASAVIMVQLLQNDAIVGTSVIVGWAGIFNDCQNIR